MYCCFSREPHFLCSMLNETLAFDSDDEIQVDGNRNEAEGDRGSAD